MERHGWAWIQQVQKPICELREIHKGKDKGKYEVTLCRGRDENGSIIRGKKVKILPRSLIEFPEVVKGR